VVSRPLEERVTLPATSETRVGIAVRALLSAGDRDAEKIRRVAMAGRVVVTPIGLGILGGRVLGSQADDAKDAQVRPARGQKLDAQEKFSDAVEAFTKAIALDGNLAEAYQRRGFAQFKLAKITESIADFDKFIELQPDAKAGHWQRGISYYYAKRYDDGRK